MTEKHLIEGACPDPGIRIGIQKLIDGHEQVRADILGVKEEVRLLKEYQREQNGKVSSLREDGITIKATLDERQRWEDRQAAAFKWWLLFGLAGAGTVSGVVFGIMQAVAR